MFHNPIWTKLSLLLLPFFYTSCYGKGKMGVATMERMNLGTGEKILNFISEKNENEMEALFSEEVVSTELNLEEGIRRLFEFCDGQITDYEKIVMGMEASVNNGLNATTFNTKYRFKINEVSYLLYYIYTPKNTFDSKKEGVRSIKIVKEIDSDKYFCYWNEIKPGIFIGE